MMRAIARLTILCWHIVIGYFVFFTVVGVAPPDHVWLVAAAVGAIVFLVPALVIFRLYRLEEFEFGWFLAVKHGGWYVLFCSVGLVLLLTGVFGLVQPALAEQFAEAHAMKVASVLVFLFWFALIFTFAGWALITLSESIAYLRLRKFIEMLMDLGISLIWLLFSAGCFWLFLEVIDDVFFHLSRHTRGTTLIVFLLATTVIGLTAGLFENTAKLAELESKENETAEV